jgi:hypothetical protein
VGQNYQEVQYGRECKKLKFIQKFVQNGYEQGRSGIMTSE